MPLFITPEQAAEYREVGFTIQDGQAFRAGTDCGGVPQFRSSTECHAICFGLNGICTALRLPILCMHEGEIIAIRALNDRGALSSRSMASLSYL